MTYQHWAGVSPHTSSCDLAETWVFTKQSLEPLHCDPSTLQARSPSHAGAPLIPKLRGHFAEFLNEGSLERLRIFSWSTCVGLRYGHPCDLRQGFSWQSGMDQFASAVASAPRHPSINACALTYRFGPRHPILGWCSLLRPPAVETPHVWYRNVDRFSIAYAFRPRLRPDSPWVD